MITMQMQKKKTLQWIKTCPFKYAISSMQGGCTYKDFYR